MPIPRGGQKYSMPPIRPFIDPRSLMLRGPNPDSTGRIDPNSLDLQGNPNVPGAGLPIGAENYPYFQDNNFANRVASIAFDPNQVFGQPFSPQQPTPSLMTGTESHYGKQKDEQSTRWDQLSAADQRAIMMTVAGEVDPRQTDLSSAAGKQEVANIVSSIMNRAAEQGKSISAVVHERSVYSTYNTPQARSIASQNLKALGSQIMPAAQDAINGMVMPSAQGITHYYSPAAMQPPGRVPDWARGQAGIPVGPSVFYNNIDPQQNPQLPPVPVGQVTSADLPPLAQTAANTVSSVFGNRQNPVSKQSPDDLSKQIELKKAQIGQLVTGMIAAHPEQAAALTQQMAAAGLNVDGTDLQGPRPPAPDPNADYRGAVSKLLWQGGFQPPTNPTFPPQSTFPGRPAGPPAGMPPASGPPPIAATGNTIPTTLPPLGTAQSMPAPSFNGYAPNRLALGPGQATTSPPIPQPGADAGIVLAPGSVPQVGGLGAGATAVTDQDPTADAGQIPLSPLGRINSAAAVAGQQPPVSPATAAQIAAQLQLGPGQATAGAPPQPSANSSAPLSPLARINGAMAVAAQQPQPSPAQVAQLAARLQLGPGQATASPPPPSPAAAALGSPQLRPPMDLTGTAVPGLPANPGAAGQLPPSLQSPFDLQASATASPDQRIAAAFGQVPLSTAMLSGQAAPSSAPNISAAAGRPIQPVPAAATGNTIPSPIMPQAATGNLAPSPVVPMAATGNTIPSPQAKPIITLASFPQKDEPVPTQPQTPTAVRGPVASQEALKAPFDPTAAVGIGSDVGATQGFQRPQPPQNPFSAGPPIIQSPQIGPITPKPVPTYSVGNTPFGPPMPPTTAQSMAPTPPAVPSSPPVTAQAPSPPSFGMPSLSGIGSAVKSFGEKAVKEAVKTWAAAGPAERAKIAGMAGPQQFWSGLDAGGMGPTDIARASYLAAQLYGPGGLYNGGGGGGWGGGNGWGGGGNYSPGSFGGWGGGNIGQGTGGAYRNR